MRVIIAAVMAMACSAAHSQTPSWRSPDRNAELGINSEVLKSIPPTDIQARIRAMQSMIDRSRAFVRRRQLPLPQADAPHGNDR